MDTLLHPREVAARYNITEETLSNWRRMKKGPPFIRLGNNSRSRPMYRLQDVIKWEQEQATWQSK